MQSIRIMLKKIISIFSAIALSLTFVSGSMIGAMADEQSELNALPSKHIVLMDYNSGKVLYQKDAESKIYPASTTKIWTAFCVLKKCKNLNQVIEIKNMPTVEGSSMYLENGEKFTVLQLLEGLLIHSSNDVAHVLAAYYGDGSVANFVKFMNEEAARYGATHTHFYNPHGLPDEKHYTTAMDMVNLSRVAYGNDIIRKIVSMKEVHFKKTAGSKLDREMFNTNKFLSSAQTMDYKGKTIPIKYDIVDGIKTGFTDDAGNCLVSTAQKNGIRLICGVFGAPGGSLYHDSRMVLDYGFDDFKTVTIFKKEDFRGEKKVKFAKPGKIKYSIASDYVVTVPKDTKIDKKDYKTKYDFNNLKLPVKKGDIIGTLNIYDNGSMVSSIGIVAENSSETYLQYIMGLLPFHKDKDSDNKNGKSADKTDNKNTDEKSDKKSKDKDKKEDNKDSKDSKSEKKDGNIVNEAKTTVTNSFSGFVGIFYGIGDFFKDLFHNISTFFSNLFTADGIKNIENSDFYKFLDKKVSSMQSVVPSKVIIFGVPILILLIILILIIGIIKDSIVRRRKNRLEKKQERKARKQKRNEMKVSDIVPKDEAKDSSSNDDSENNSDFSDDSNTKRIDLNSIDSEDKK